MKIIIFGINRTTLLIAKYLRKNHDIIGVSDNIAKIDFYGNYSFIKPYQISSLEYDYILVSNEDKRVCESIKNSLIKDGVMGERIIFHELFEERVHQVM